MLRNFHFQYSW